MTQLQLKFPVKTPMGTLQDSVYAAMETGNFSKAREAIAGADDRITEAQITNLRHEIKKEYGYHI